MNIKNQELGLTKAAKRNLLRLEGVETLQDLVDMYSEQELLEDQRFEKRTKTWTSIIECLEMYGLQLYPNFYERKKGLGEIPTATDPENILLTDLELPEALIGKMKYWEVLKTMGDLARNLKEYGLKHSDPDEFDLGEFSGRVMLPAEESEVSHIDWTHRSGFAYGGNNTYYHRDTKHIDLKGGGYRSEYTYRKEVGLSLEEKRLLIRTLALYGLYPEHARVRPTL